ncbi:23S rRNA (adenine(1618)-N(6))-methyltransferase [Pseudomonas fluvialis]|uniref:Ribosomal RNA large subunit methyltransferase F n=1 Tax=Pseudomonas fluvialis TaxID=1793966 RepID=A0ABQ2ACJ5_9PSED|nr:23S rRNA (adenine(1618)-N(6))-methyltransferase RlmF [Pseudomonas fluvialis]OXM39452.1 23S rRNA (adenine(1618)-N(6))-methyltransferase [Pseudomonas fluvialis]GGH88463.1 ribosomal RNA large subunit methyltransferase F [Pseudomonas fluvialis]
MPPRQPPSPPPSRHSPEGKGQLHPRNRHQGRYDFPALLQAHPALARFVIRNPYGKPSIDFADPAAVRTFNRALLAQLYGLHHWDIPEGYLCPPVPGRADYLHGLADVLATSNAGIIPRGEQVRVLDIGTGANCIYPLLGHIDYGWQFVGSDIDPQALAAAQRNLVANGLDQAIELRLQSQRTQIFRGLLRADERFHLTLCNPPFHASASEAHSGSRRKWRNLGKLDPSRQLPALNFGGQHNELWCPGGELAFIQQMIEESREHAAQVLWFSCLVSKAGNLPMLHARLRQVGARQIRQVDMAQGQKQSRFLAWSFLDNDQQAAWRRV